MIGWAPKVAVAVTEQDSNAVVEEIRYSDIRVAISIEIGYGDREGSRPDRNRRGRTECADACPEQQAERAVIVIGGDNVGLSIIIEIAHRVAAWTESG